MGGHPTRTQASGPSRVLALSISLAIQVGMAWILVNAVGEARVETAPRDDSVLHVHFIAPASPSNMPRPTAPQATPRARATDRARGSVSEAPRASIEPVAAAAMDSVALELAPPDLPITFGKDVMSRARPALEATPLNTRFDIRDRSFGGRLLSISKARYCSELRSALARHPESTAAILESMKDYRCQT